jgi:2-iminobutanoate/2-iminopropanoate deaminase
MKTIETAGVKAGGHYSSATRAGDFIFTAGQTPRNEARELIGQSVGEQTIATMNNLKAVLSSAGASLEDVVKVNVYLAELSDFTEFDATYSGFFSELPPPRTTIGCQLRGIKVEIDAVAYVGEK